jgi:DNA-binding Lrp family transcriptional regulator
MKEAHPHNRDPKASKAEPYMNLNTSQLKTVSTLDDIDRKLIQLLQCDFPLTQRPLREISQKLNTSEEEIMRRLKGLHSAGIIRRIGPIIDGLKVGLAAATLVALKVPKDRVDAVANIINQYHNVSHNYEREHEYNIWFTLSASTRQEIETTLKDIIQKAGLNHNNVLNLPTRHRFKINVQFQLTEQTQVN